MITIVIVGAAGSILTGSLLWGGFLLFVAFIASLPAIATQNWTALVPWPLLSVAAISAVARIAEIYSEPTGYLAIATLAFVVVVELDVFTSVELGRRFAIGFGVLTTLAIEALWIIAQFYSDRWLGTDFLSTQTELQEDIVIVTAVGFTIGGLLYWYFARFEPLESTAGSSHRMRSR